jgi:hypothetical protein
MERILKAEIVSFDQSEEAYTLGFAHEANGEISEYLILERSTHSEDDDGVHLEIDDQIHSGYNLVQSVLISEGFIDFELSKELGNPSARRIKVKFDATPENKNKVQTGFNRILHDIRRR